MGQVKVRALQICFVGGSKRNIGDEFMVAEGTKLRTKKLPPVMELVKSSDQAPTKKAETQETAED